MKRLRTLFSDDKPEPMYGKLQVGMRIPAMDSCREHRFLSCCDCGNFVARTLKELNCPTFQCCNECKKEKGKENGGSRSKTTRGGVNK